MRDERDRPAKPWLTVILDDYSRAVAGYRLSFVAPPAEEAPSFPPPHLLVVAREALGTTL